MRKLNETVMNFSATATGHFDDIAASGSPPVLG
jgi:hypothetical protein